MLYILNFARRVNHFSQSSMLAAKELGWEFHIAGNWGYASEKEKRTDEEKYEIRIHQINFKRNPLHPQNLQAYRQLHELMNRERFDLVHCNTPIGGFLGRIAAQMLKVGVVVYQAHGFHFYAGAPLLSWILYYPLERFLARWTDALITINQEDRERAHRMHLRAGGQVHYLPGVGVDTDRFNSQTSQRSALKEALGIPGDAMLMLSIGELNENKNHQVVLRAIKSVPSLHYAIAGAGPLLGELKSMATSLGLSDRVHFLGFRPSVQTILQAADFYCLPSRREGLSVSIMEAMASELPVVCSDIRGNRDLVVEGAGGFLVPPQSPSSLANCIQKLIADPEMRANMGRFNRERVAAYSLAEVKCKQVAIYRELTSEGGEQR